MTFEEMTLDQLGGRRDELYKRLTRITRFMLPARTRMERLQEEILKLKHEIDHGERLEKRIGKEDKRCEREEWRRRQGL